MDVDTELDFSEWPPLNHPGSFANVQPSSAPESSKSAQGSSKPAVKLSSTSGSSKPTKQTDVQLSLAPKPSTSTPKTYKPAANLSTNPGSSKSAKQSTAIRSSKSAAIGSSTAIGASQPARPAVTPKLSSAASHSESPRPTQPAQSSFQLSSVPGLFGSSMAQMPHFAASHTGASGISPAAQPSVASSYAAPAPGPSFAASRHEVAGPNPSQTRPQGK